LTIPIKGTLCKAKLPELPTKAKIDLRQKRTFIVQRKKNFISARID